MKTIPPTESIFKAFSKALSAASSPRSRQRRAGFFTLADSGAPGRSGLGRGLCHMEIVKGPAHSLWRPLLSLQGLNMILSKPDNPGKASSEDHCSLSNLRMRSPGNQLLEFDKETFLYFLFGLQSLCSCKITLSHHFFFASKSNFKIENKVSH